jgi:hypothetical protein
MGLRLSSATAKPRAIAVPFEGGDLHVEYRPSSYTVAELDALQANARNTGHIVQSMLRTLVSWDLEYDEDSAPTPELVGTTIPLETEALTQTVPTSVFVVIMQAMQADQSAGEADALSSAT